MRKLTRKQKRQIATVAAKKNADIDLSEMPEVVDWSGAEMGKFSRPAKKAGDDAAGCGSCGLAEELWARVSDAR